MICCESYDCTREAVSTCYWPGQTRNFCDPCVKRALRVADTMGFELKVQALGMGPTPESSTEGHNAAIKE